MRTSTTKEQLLKATLKLISEKGYLGATTREIAQEAGVTELTLFRHFGSKERLFEALLNSYTFLPMLRDLLPELTELSSEDALRLLATRFLLSLKERKSMVKILYSEVNVYPEKVRKVYHTFINEVKATLAGYFNTLQRQGKLRNISPEMAAQVFHGLVFSYFRAEEIMGKTGMTKKKMDKDVRDFIDIFVHGIALDEQ